MRLPYWYFDSSLSSKPPIIICSCISPYFISFIALFVINVILILKLWKQLVLLIKKKANKKSSPKPLHNAIAKTIVLCYNRKHVKNRFIQSNLKFPFPDMEGDKKIIGDWDGGSLALIYGLKAFLFKLFHTEGQLHRKSFICMKC